MAEKYKTILKEGTAEIIEKKSRFISYAKPVKTDEEAREFIEKIKKENWNATHNVFAYQIGDRNEIQRFSDDGAFGRRNKKYRYCGNKIFRRNSSGNGRPC